MPHLSKVVESIIKFDEPLNVKPFINSPPPEARALMVRNLIARHYAGANSLAGYHTNVKPEGKDLDTYAYPDNFYPQFDSVRIQLLPFSISFLYLLFFSSFSLRTN